MKKNYPVQKFFIALCILLSIKAHAQLSGVVTINSTQPASATNFTSFAALANTLNAQGVSGPLTVNVNLATYTEQVNFTQAPGISATNTITVNGNGATLTFTSASSTVLHTLLLSGADYMTFNNLNVIGGGASYALTVHLWNGANNNTFNNCAIYSPTVGTVTGLCPFSVSGTSVSATAAGTSGNNNTVNSCTMTGGYYSTVFAGASAAPFNTGNTVRNSKAIEFYSYGIYNLYCQGTTVKGNIVERPTRTAVTTCYSIYFSTSSTADELVEGNHVRRLFDAAPTSASAAYGIYFTADATPGHEHIIRNNVVSDIKSAGAIYAIYVSGAAYAKVHHNTIAIIDAAATAGLAYGLYITGPNCNARNNVSYMNRGGSGAKYPIYLTTGATSLTCNYNVAVNTGTAGTNGTGYLGSSYTTLANWQAGTGYDMNSSNADPMFLSPGLPTMNYEPTSLVINNMGVPLGVMDDYNLNGRSPLFPDPGAFEIYNTICNSAPGANSFVTPTLNFCPGKTLDLNLLNSGTYTNSGYSIQWMSSTTSMVGPYTVAAVGATLNSFTTPPINVTTYYQAVITCTNGNLSYTTPAQGVTVSPLTTSVVPYYENFESLALNELPNCYWSASNQVGGVTITNTTSLANLRVPRNGTSFATFKNSTGGANYFYTSGIHMSAGITYSAALWFIAESVGFNNWADLSIWVGPNQSPTGLMPIVSTNGTLTPQLYTLLQDTFMVPQTGLYYVAIKATPGAGAAPYLSFDDLSITIPCQHNSPNMTLSTNQTTICVGQAVTLSGAGANSYTWGAGQTSTVITESPVFPTTYTLTGQNALSGCTTSLTQFIEVLPSPQVAALTNDPVVCANQTVSLYATGAVAYFWSHGPTTASTTGAPNATTNYSVIGTNSLGCSDMAVVQVSVYPAPPVNGSASSMLICAGEELTLNGTGAQSYTWLLSPTSIQLGSPIVVKPMASSIYTLVGTDARGCEGMTTVSFGVDECAGLGKVSGQSSTIRIFPNPGTGLYTLQNSSKSDMIEVSDIAGRIVLKQSCAEGQTMINIDQKANGIYYVKVIRQNSSDVIKIVKVNH